jgi:hypothetical protein
MSPYWRQHYYGSAAFLILVLIAVGWATVRPNRNSPQALAGVQGGAKGLVEEKTWAQRKNDEIQKPADFFADLDRSDNQGFTIEKRLRKVLLESGGKNSPGTWIDVAYVNVRNKSKLTKTFDADVYFGLGNSADFGYFPFLGDGHKQLFISQDVARGGCQWVVRLSPNFKVLFDGQKLGVGREGPDLGVVDLDDDGTFEILAPITDFYEFQDKMSMYQIPLPTIVFKYDPNAEKYLPANAQFKNYVYEELEKVAGQDSTPQTDHRSKILNNLFIYIYAGEEKRGWDFYDDNYQGNDKEEIRKRVKANLRTQPVYYLIYKRNRTAKSH